MNQFMTIALLSLTGLATAPAKCQTAPVNVEFDDRYKADLLLIVAHPDDETGDIAGFLAREIYDDQRRIAVIFATRGDSGGSSISDQGGDALGAEREIEGRKALAAIGVTNVWFLGEPDIPSQDVLRSLENWDHGSALGQIVRLVRLTRPEVILTWLPLYVAGENHSDHQASSVIATEAFDTAGDPTAFPEQLVQSFGSSKRTEGLHPWQPKKIYYYSDAFDSEGYWWQHLPERSPFRENFLIGAGPSYANTDISGSQHVSYARLAAKELSFYLTQEGKIGETALETRNFKNFEYPTRLIFGKSLVDCSRTGDVFEGTGGGPAAYVPHFGYRSQPHHGLSIELGGPWQFYSEFWRAHDLQHIAKLLPVPEVSIGLRDRSLHVPLILHNDSMTFHEIRLFSILPPGWSDAGQYWTFPLGPNSAYTVDAIATPSKDDLSWSEMKWRATTDEKEVGSICVRVYFRGAGGLPQ